VLAKEVVDWHPYLCAELSGKSSDVWNSRIRLPVIPLTPACCSQVPELEECI
jgi:hypothetical protein